MVRLDVDSPAFANLKLLCLQGALGGVGGGASRVCLEALMERAWVLFVVVTLVEPLSELEHEHKVGICKLASSRPRM